MYIKSESGTGITKPKWLANTIKISMRYQSQIYSAKYLCIYTHTHTHTHTRERISFIHVHVKEKTDTEKHNTFLHNI